MDVDILLLVLLVDECLSITIVDEMIIILVRLPQIGRHVYRFFIGFDDDSPEQY